MVAKSNTERTKEEVANSIVDNCFEEKCEKSNNTKTIKNNTEIVKDKYKIVFTREKIFILDIENNIELASYKRDNKGISYATTFINSTFGRDDSIKFLIVKTSAKLTEDLKIKIDEDEQRNIREMGEAEIRGGYIIEHLVNVMDDHIGDDPIKKMYSISLLSLGVINIDEPLNIFVYGSPESGKTDLQNKYMDIMPTGNKDIASDFTPRALMYSDLESGTLISINDKVLNDAIGKILNEVCDSNSWKNGHICATVIDGKRVNLIFPPRVLFWMNANKKISEYTYEEVEGNAVESRFMSFKKEYTNEEKSKIFLNKKSFFDKEFEKSYLRYAIKIIIKNCNYVNYNQNILDIIEKKSNEFGIKSLRSKNRNLAMAQVFAMVRAWKNVSEIDMNEKINIFPNDLTGHIEVIEEDVQKVFELLKEIGTLEMQNSEVAKSIKKVLISKDMFKMLPEEGRTIFSAAKLRDKLKIQYDDVKSAIDLLLNNREIGFESIKTKNFKSTRCYYLENETSSKKEEPKDDGFRDPEPKQHFDKNNPCAVHMNHSEDRICQKCNNKFTTDDKYRNLCQNCLDIINGISTPKSPVDL